jgi:hypothetical protein
MYHSQLKANSFGKFDHGTDKLRTTSTLRKW